MDPLFRLQQAEEAKLLSQAMVKKVRSRMKYALEGVSRVERACGLTYPPYYVEPALTVASSGLEVGQLGLMYARTVPVEGASGLEIWVQLTAPLVAFGSKHTIHAVLAHEFLHYVELVRRFIRFETLSQEVSSTLYEATYSDFEQLFQSERLLKDKALIRLVKKRFPQGFVDEKLQDKTVKMWLEKGLPAVRLPQETNVVRVPMSMIVNAKFDPLLKLRLDEFEKFTMPPKG